jgi:hypothetical protein
LQREQKAGAVTRNLRPTNAHSFYHSVVLSFKPAGILTLSQIADFASIAEHYSAHQSNGQTLDLENELGKGAYEQQILAF